MGASTSHAMTAKHVDLQKYAGVWHEIAKFPLVYQKGCDGATAEYSVMCTDDGRPFIYLKNTCLCNCKPVRSRQGIAWAPCPEEPGKFKIKFIDPGPAQGIVSDYWLHETDYCNYALVGSPDKCYFWILSRKPQICKAAFQDLCHRSSNYGYDMRKLEVNEGTVSQ